MLVHHQQATVVPSRLVILGASGFVGKAIVVEAERHSIPVLALGSAQVDLTQPQAVATLSGLLRPSDSVIFAAAIDNGNRSTSEDVVRNILMARHVAQAIGQTPVAHLTYLSSESIYGNRDGRISEATPAVPTSLYGAMHQMREVILTAEAGVPLAVLRLTGLYGADDTHNAYGPNRFIRQALSENTIQLFGQGEERRDHLHVGEAAAMIVQTAMLQSTGLLNIASGRSLSFFSIAQHIATITGAQISYAPRRQPILHRHVDPTERVMALPDIIPQPMETLLPQLCDEFAHGLRANV